MNWWKKLKAKIEAVLTWYDDLFASRYAMEVPYVDQESLDVRDFQRRFKQLSHPGRPVHLTKRKLYERAECMREELMEFEEGVDQQDLAAQADALIDLVYFAKGTAQMLGLPWEMLWSDVHSANMDKVPGFTKRGHLTDVTKPEGWVPPQTEIILSNAGYNRTQFVNQHGVIVENRCFDDPTV